MDFNFFMPVRIITGENCVRENPGAFSRLGEKALIVTGKSSAKSSGALDDVIAALDEAGIGYAIFDEITQNPMLSVCVKGGQAARDAGADFIIGIGGGSPLDASKAIAIFAANDLEPEEVYSLKWKNKPLPIAAVGTTAGTGSEITPFSVLTVDSTGMKASIRHDDCYNTVCFGDPKYTFSLPLEFTVSTALDALSHAIEGYFISIATDISDMFAVKAVELLYNALSEIKEGGGAAVTHDLRERLYYGSLYAGMTLNRCSTAYCHTMGYPLTEDFGMPHGRACAVYLPSYIERARKNLPDKAKALEAGAKVSLDEITKLILALNPRPDIVMTPEQARDYAARWTSNRNFDISPGGFTQPEALDLLGELFVK